MYHSLGHSVSQLDIGKSGCRPGITTLLLLLLCERLGISEEHPDILASWLQVVGSCKYTGFSLELMGTEKLSESRFLNTSWG